MERKEIVIETVDGPQAIVGWVGKGLAVTPYYTDAGNFDFTRYTITHTPTGLGIYLDLRPVAFEEFVEAVWLADEEWGEIWAKEEVYRKMPFENMWLAKKLAWMVAPTLFPEWRLDWVLGHLWMCERRSLENGDYGKLVPKAVTKECPLSAYGFVTPPSVWGGAVWRKQMKWWGQLSAGEKAVVCGWVAELLGVDFVWR